MPALYGFAPSLSRGGANPAASLPPARESSYYRGTMKIIIGHGNMDLDCIASMVLARYLFPDHRPVRSSLIHPIARNLYNLFEDRLSFARLQELEGRQIERVVVVDTRTLDRIRDFLPYFDPANTEVVVFDHHGEDTSDIPGAVVREKPVGANTTLLGLELLHRNITIAAEDATIALTGIYADTGNFTHENVGYGDFQVASFCLQCGGSLQLVNTFLRPFKEEHQLALFHELLGRLVFRNVRGHLVLLASLELEHKAPGLAAVTEKVFEIESPDALFAVFGFRKERQAIVIARSHSRDLDVQKALEAFGGGGHAMAASAMVKDCTAGQVFSRLDQHLQATLQPAVTAGQIMTPAPLTILETESLLEASLSLERADQTGAPVVDASGKLVGFISLRDIMKGRKAQAMHAPAKGYMTRRVISGRPQTPVRGIERLLFANNIGHLPIVEDDRVVGMVTRGDYLRLIAARGQADREFLEALSQKVEAEEAAKGAGKSSRGRAS
ncbi:MAG: CBS domain-containing protein [Spirochaetales bacterium]|nr:CBS domain-containing protein [Spirochaetales bacterium]